MAELRRLVEESPYRERLVAQLRVALYTPLSSRLDAREVVGLLDRLFTSFDELVDRRFLYDL